MKQLVRLWKRPSRDGLSFVFVLDYKDEQGKRRQVSLGHADRRKAQRQRDQKERELRMGMKEVCVIDTRSLLHDYSDNTTGQITPSTLSESIRDLEEFMMVSSNRNIADITYEDGERFIKHCLAKGNRPATVNKKLRHLHRVFALAVKRRQLEINPFQGLGPLRVTRRQIHTFTDDEIELLVKCAPDLLWKTRIRIARVAGLRAGELLNLTWNDIHTEQLMVVVQPKEDTPSTWSWHPKDYEIRELPLDAQAVELLQQLRLQCPNWQPYALLKPQTYARFQQRRKFDQLNYAEQRIPEREYSKEFSSLVQKAGVSVGTMHDLRRSAITAWAENPDLQPHEVMKLAGHSALETTIKHYVHFRRSLIDRARGSVALVKDSKSVARLLRAAT